MNRSLGTPRNLILITCALGIGAVLLPWSKLSLSGTDLPPYKGFTSWHGVSAAATFLALALLLLATGRGTGRAESTLPAWSSGVALLAGLVVVVIASLYMLPVFLPGRRATVTGPTLIPHEEAQSMADLFLKDLHATILPGVYLTLALGAALVVLGALQLGHRPRARGSEAGTGSPP